MYAVLFLIDGGEARISPRRLRSADSYFVAGLLTASPARFCSLPRAAARGVFFGSVGLLCDVPIYLRHRRHSAVEGVC